MKNQEILLKNGLSKPIFYLLVFLLPFQTRKIFFTPHSGYFGYHIFYNTMYLYLTDLVFFGLIVIWIYETYKISRETSPARAMLHRIYTGISRDITYKLLGIFWLILALSLIFSREISLSLYGLVKIAEFMLFFAYLREILWKYPQGALEISREIRLIFTLIVVAAVFQSILGITQYLGQSSVGLKLLGEEYLQPGLKGLAQFYSQSNTSGISLNMRAYGTFPHPNVLAGFLFFGLLVCLNLSYNLAPTLSAGRRKRILLPALSIPIIITGLVVTFSRFAWIVASLGVMAWYLVVFLRIRNQLFFKIRTSQRISEPAPYRPGRLAIMGLVIIFSLGLNFLFFGQQIKDRLVGAGEGKVKMQESLAEREQFNDYALEMIKDKPFLGVGLKQMVLEIDHVVGERVLPHLHQPVHNIFLLIAAEAGVGALVIFIIFLLNIVRRAIKNFSDRILKSTLLIVLFGFLAIGFFDHYLWTIQQGSLMLWLVTGLLATK